MLEHSGFVSLVHFRYRFSDTKKDRHASKIMNISFASFDIASFSTHEYHLSNLASTSTLAFIAISSYTWGLTL